MPLTEDAKRELQEAIRIVREDRFEKFARGYVSKNAPQKDPLIDPEKDPEKDVPPPPPGKDPETDPEKEEKPKRTSRYWGELMDE